MKGRGQAALEYLLTYGWAILIVIIVGASLYALGVFNPGTFTGKRTTGFTQFQPNDHKLDTNANLTIFFGNRVGKTVTLGNVSATYKTRTCTSDEVNGTTFGPNTQTNLTMICKSQWGLSGSAPLDERSSYSTIIDIQYIDPDSGLTHTDVGTLFGAVER